MATDLNANSHLISLLQRSLALLKKNTHSVPAKFQADLLALIVAYAKQHAFSAAASSGRTSALCVAVLSRLRSPTLSLSDVFAISSCWGKKHPNALKPVIETAFERFELVKQLQNALPAIARTFDQPAPFTKDSLRTLQEAAHLLVSIVWISPNLAATVGASTELMSSLLDAYNRTSTATDLLDHSEEALLPPLADDLRSFLSTRSDILTCFHTALIATYFTPRLSSAKLESASALLSKVLERAQLPDVNAPFYLISSLAHDLEAYYALHNVFEQRVVGDALYADAFIERLHQRFKALVPSGQADTTALKLLRDNQQRHQQKGKSKGVPEVSYPASVVRCGFIAMTLMLTFDFNYRKGLIEKPHYHTFLVNCKLLPAHIDLLTCASDLLPDQDPAFLLRCFDHPAFRSSDGSNGVDVEKLIATLLEGHLPSDLTAEQYDMPKENPARTALASRQNVYSEPLDPSRLHFGR
jgi:hypothetical protein